MAMLMLGDVHLSNLRERIQQAINEVNMLTNGTDMIELVRRNINRIDASGDFKEGEVSLTGISNDLKTKVEPMVINLDQQLKLLKQNLADTENQILKDTIEQLRQKYRNIPEAK